MTGIMRLTGEEADGGRIVAIEHFTVEYHGTALEEHVIDVKDLAPSLIALADAAVVAQGLLLDEPAPPPSLQVQAHRGGSFDVDLILRTYQAAEDLLSTRPALAASVAVSLATPIFGALRWISSRARSGMTEDRTEVAPGHIHIEWPDGTVLDTTTDAAELVDDMDFRHMARGFVEPLARGDVERIDVSPAGGAEQERIQLTRHDLRGFESPPSQPGVLSVSEREVVLDLITVGLADNHKWRVSAGGSPFWVSMDDLAFILSMDKGTERFGKHDRLRCILREKQVESASGKLDLERSIVKVLSHTPSPVEDTLDFG